MFWRKRKSRERDLERELRNALELETEEQRENGLSFEEARYAARRAFGNVALIKEDARAAWGWLSPDRLLQDLRFAIRQFRTNPGFAGTAVFVLALGICAAAAIFGFVDAALLKPLPYRDPSRLVAVFETTAKSSRSFVSYRDYLDWKRLNPVFRSIDAFAENGGFTLNTKNGAQVVSGTRVTAGFFHTLGITPILGRDFQPGEDRPAAPPTVVLSYAAWQARFGGRTDVLGQTITLNNSANTIIGVLPRDFHFAPVANGEFWTTLRESGGTFGESNPCEGNRACHNLLAIARLKDGVSVPTALAAMKSIARQLEIQYPESNRGQGASVALLSDLVVGNVRPILLALLSATGLLLLMSCVNVTSLVLARSDSRKREIAVRNALGASRARLVRQFATEAAILATLGCFLGLLGAEWVMQLLTKLIPPAMIGNMPYLLGLGLNRHIVAFAAAISIACAALLAVAPTWRVSLAGTAEDLKEGARGSAGITWRRFGSSLVVFELMIAMVLLVGAGLLTKSLYRLLHEDIGLQADHLATLQIEGPVSRYTTHARQIALAQRIVARTAALPGVKSAGVSNALPVGWVSTAWFRVAGRPFHGEHNDAVNRTVGSKYFRALEARLLRGRYFNDADDESKPHVVIVNQTLAKQYFPGEDPIGKQILYEVSSKPPMQIVGVVDDIKEGSLDAAARPALYVPFNQGPSRFFSLAVRTSQDEKSVFRSLATAIHEVEPGAIIYGESTMADRINRSPEAYLHRCSAWLTGGFAAIAFVVEIVGLYGVVAYSAGRRTREIGIRMALGASPASVHRLILREATRLAIAGIAIGAVCSVIAAALIRRLLFGVQPWDAATLCAVVTTLAVSAVLAAYIPARRAASVSPVEALRAE